MTAPLISVVMPVYNAEKFLVDAVASIINQHWRDWELICINDGSTDSSPQILNWFAQQDSRIRVVHQSNTGIVKALNRGCELATAALIARMDADDIAVANRLDKQIGYMREHPKCVVVGGAILEIDSDGDRLGISSLPEDHAAIEHNLLHRKTGHFHPTVMMRAEAWRAAGGYRLQYQWVEDHDLWLRMAQRGELANLPDVLLGYRQHASSVCWQRSQQQRELMNALLSEAYRQRGLELSEESLIHSETKRTAANPGKWARAAAKGGYPKTAAKHLALLARSHGLSNGYFLRMTAECMLRSVGGCIKRLTKNKTEALPDLAHWHRKRTAIQPEISKAA